MTPSSPPYLQPRYGVFAVFRGELFASSVVSLYCFTGLFKTGPVLDKCMTPDLAEMVIFVPGRAVGKTRWTCLLLSLALLARTCVKQHTT